MIKSIEVQHPVKITIIKNGEVIANLYANCINGGIDTDKIKVEAYRYICDATYNMKLEV